jgi:hypothetical protein
MYNKLHLWGKKKIIKNIKEGYKWKMKN